MNRMTLIDTAPIPGGGELRLFQEGEHYSIKIAGGGDLMSTRMHGSEDALARIGCERIATRTHARVLIGGLGMGFTLAAALKLMRANAEIVVAELVPGVVLWNRGPLGEHAGHPMSDARVSIREVDVAQLLKSERSAYDAILLDVDNGPGGLTHESNNWLYSTQGLSASLQALRQGGLLAVWSAHPDRAFTERLRRCGFDAKEVPVRAHGNKGARHMIWLAEKLARPAVEKISGAAVSAQAKRRRRSAG